MSDSSKQVPGAKCLIQFEDHFLFVRINYAHKGWTLPGGKLEVGETHEQAAIRETLEEVGIKLDEVQHIGSSSQAAYEPNDMIEYFHSKVDEPTFAVDGHEIVEAGWFKLTDLPAERSLKIDTAFHLLHARN